MARRNRLAFALGALAAALVPALAVAQTVKLTLGHGAAPGNPRHEAAVKFAELVKGKSNGRIEVQVAPSAQLGDDAAMVTALRSGALDLLSFYQIHDRFRSPVPPAARMLGSASVGAASM